MGSDFSVGLPTELAISHTAPKFIHQPPRANTTQRLTQRAAWVCVRVCQLVSVCSALMCVHVFVFVYLYGCLCAHVHVFKCDHEL